MGHHHPDIPAVFLWSEKSGCTSLLQWFLAQTGRLDDAVEHSDWIHDWEFEVWKADPTYAPALVDRIVAGTPVFKLVRDPFARAVSQYLLMLTLADDSEHFTVPIRRRIREHVHGTADTDATFSFLEYLDWLATQDVGGLNDHLTPQHTALEDALAARGTPVELIRLEHFDDDMRAVEARCSLPAVDLARAASSTHHTARADHTDAHPEAVVRLRPPAPLPEGYPIPRTELFMTAGSVARIAEIYAVDIDAYGYHPPTVVRADRSPAEHVVLAVEERSPGAAVAALLGDRFPAKARHELGEPVPAPSDTIVVVQDPVGRVAAWWHHVLTSVDHPLHDRARSATLADLVGDPGAVALDNGQVRLLAGVGSEVSFGALGAGHLQRAELTVLHPRTLVGVGELPGPTMVALGARYGWRLPHDTPHPDAWSTLTLTEAERDVALEVTELDRQLYETALRTFHERWAELPAHVRVRRRTLRVEQRALTAAAAARSAIRSRLDRGR